MTTPCQKIQCDDSGETYAMEDCVCVCACVRTHVCVSVCVLCALDSLLMRVIKGIEWPCVGNMGWTEVANGGNEVISYMTWPGLGSAPPIAISETTLKHQ